MSRSPDLPQEPVFQPQAIWLSLFLLSAATLAFEINLTRLFSVAQFYHFAFMIVSIALLGYGASGSALAIFPRLLGGKPSQSLSRLSLLTGFSILLAYLLTNLLPFDSYSIVVDKRQVFILILHYAALAAPFFFSGMALGKLLSSYPHRAGSSYAVNLLGSAAGCILALVAPPILGGEGMVTLSSLLAGLAALANAIPTRQVSKNILLYIVIACLLLINLADISMRLTHYKGIPILELHISPYKSLSYALQYPTSKITASQWNAFSRVDVVSSGGIHSLPGLSYRYLDPLPLLEGLFVDGDDLNPMINYSTGSSFTGYLPNAIAFLLRPQASTLLLEPRGGLDILTAQSLSNGWVTCVEINPLIVDIAPVYADQRLFINEESERSYLRRTQWQYDVIVLSLNSSFHPVQSGAFTLAEDYRYTVESFRDMIEHLASQGLFVATRWLQDPPSEDLRLFALGVTAIENTGGNPRQQIVAFRGYNTGTILIKNGTFSKEELSTIRNFAAERAFDLTYAPDIQAEETNRYNILPESTYHQTYLSLLEANPRQSFYASYEYDVRPPTDDHPFFGHYFKWSQTPQILAEFGKAWLPFGGGGYFVILILLLLAILLAGGLILLPVGFSKLRQKNLPATSSPFIVRNLVYFGLLGFAFLFVEIPLIQRFIVYLGNPAYAVTVVLFALLFFSGIGSQLNRHISLRWALGALSLVIVFMPLLLPRIFEWTLGMPLAIRLVIAVLTLAPAGFLMGVPFPAGIRLFSQGQIQNINPGGEIAPRADIPWIWAINGAASVIAPILAALLALTYSFSLVLWIGAGCYMAAMITAWLSPRPGAAQPPGR